MNKMLPASIVLSFFVLATPALALGNPVVLRACRAREGVINQRMTSLVNLATTMLDKFDSIAMRVENYYTTKVVPGGKTVANYDKLVADIQTKKAVVRTDLATAQTNSGSFNCSTGNPRAVLTQFRMNMQTVKGALQDYRTAIKNLIVAVRSVNGTI